MMMMAVLAATSAVSAAVITLGLSEDDVEDHRKKPRGPRTKWNHDEALQCIRRDYFGRSDLPDSPLFRGAAFIMMF